MSTERAAGGASKGSIGSRLEAPDPRAVRVALAPSVAHVGLDPMILEPLPIPVEPVPSVAGVGIFGGAATNPDGPTVVSDPTASPSQVRVDGHVTSVSLTHLDPARAILRTEPAPDDGRDGHGTAVRVLLEPAVPTPDGRGVVRREVVIDGWRIELDLESERRAALRDRARRGREESAHGGPTEVHAIIPGRIVRVSVEPGDAVVASQQLLVVEAMKMQNELRAPRDGTISKVAVASGDTIEIGDLLLVLE